MPVIDIEDEVIKESIIDPMTDDEISTVDPDFIEKKGDKFTDKFRLRLDYSEREKAKSVKSWLQFLEDTTRANDIAIKIFTAFEKHGKINRDTYASLFNAYMQINIEIEREKLKEQQLMFPSTMNTIIARCKHNVSPLGYGIGHYYR